MGAMCATPDAGGCAPARVCVKVPDSAPPYCCRPYGELRRRVCVKADPGDYEGGSDYAMSDAAVRKTRSWPRSWANISLF
jgi:hypothetical protein